MLAASARSSDPHTNHRNHTPIANMKLLKSTLQVSALALGLLSFAGNAQAAIITTSPNLLPVGAVYSDAGIFQTYGGPALQFVLTLPRLTIVADETKIKVGLDQVATFIASFEANLEVFVNGISQGVSSITTGGITGSRVFNRYDAGGGEILTGTFQTEMLQLDLFGGGLPPGVMLRESPTLHSNGQTTTVNIGGGQYQIDSFFDVFTELTIDGGATWMPSTSGSGHISLQGVPEPANVSLLVLGLLGVAGRRCRKQA